ncbi:MAG: transcriptional repressor LexA [Chloroflexota bacterium]|nr:transcriptional repressor LexA [Chloroflexota bacterium]MDE2856189.1 transcriptional repressor LexA [Chloroflexota bacterium]MDE2947426.1 transcriptional repressor LexA [Chloroflexota bacterium]
MKEFSRLSKRQQHMMRFMHSYTQERGFPPSIREIGEECDIGSTSVVNYNLNKLVDAGYIERSGKVSRGLRIVAAIPGLAPAPRVYGAPAQPRVALVGRIAAGEPISLPEDIGHHIDEDDYIAVPPQLLGGFDESEVYALTVRGDSMVDSMIQDGDIVILRRQHTADNGEMVAAWLPEANETTLKHFYREAESIRLQPANNAYEPIYVHPANCEVKGKVLSVMRSFR